MALLWTQKQDVGPPEQPHARVVSERKLVVGRQSPFISGESDRVLAVFGPYARSPVRVVGTAPAAWVSIPSSRYVTRA
jgi:hypothetical protein